MNKYIFCLAAAALSLGFTACEDVPAPYGINNSGNGGNGGDNTGENKTIFAATFDEGTDGFEFQNVTLSDGLTYVWKQDVYNGKGYLKASAFANNKSNVSEAWAVSPAINLKDCTEATLDFRQAINKIAPGVPSEMYSVWASTDYAGDVKTATWTQLNVPNFPEGTSWTFSDAGTIDLKSFCGNEKVYIAYKYTSTEEASGTWEVDEFTIKGNGTAMSGGGSDTPSTPGTAQGDGTKENPYNAVGATAYANTLGADVNSPADVYIKGKVASIEEAYGAQYGNGSFTISEDGTAANGFKVWRALYLDNKKYTDGQTALKVGDEVIVCGKVVNFKGNTPETVQGQAFLYSLNGVTEGGDTPSTPDTPDTPVTPSGDNLLTNGGFETWTSGVCEGWTSTTSAGNATVEQSSDAHSGSSAILVKGVASSNKRLASKEYTLNPGTYVMSFYVKGAGQVRPGYVPSTDGTVGSYMYGDYATTTAGEWTLVTYEFTLTEKTTLNFVVMNPKTSTYAEASDKLIDDFSVTTKDGGIASAMRRHFKK